MNNSDYYHTQVKNKVTDVTQLYKIVNDIGFFRDNEGHPSDEKLDLLLRECRSRGILKEE